MMIEIDKATIRKNPNAGKTHYEIPGPWEITGTCIGPIPDFLKDIAIVTVAHHRIKDPAEYEFIMHDLPSAEVLDKVKEHKGLSINCSREIQRIETMTPEPSYHYKYKDPLILCSECRKEVKLSDIEKDYFIDQYMGEREMDICPYCGSHNSFDYTFQDIKDVL
jgi:hypothetical protein